MVGKRDCKRGKVVSKVFLEGEKRGCVDSGMRDIEVLVTNESELECSRLEFYPFRGAF